MARTPAERERHNELQRARRTQPGYREKVRDAERRYRGKQKVENPEYFRASNLKKLFGLSLGQYEEMAAAQKYKCAICRKPETAISHHTGKPRRLAVDHHHASGAVRGLLCTCCNTAIGKFGGDIGLMIKAIAYLEHHGLFSREHPQKSELSIQPQQGDYPNGY